MRPTSADTLSLALNSSLVGLAMLAELYPRCLLDWKLAADPPSADVPAVDMVLSRYEYCCTFLAAEIGAGAF